jgi:UV DNA damage endonuclease
LYDTLGVPLVLDTLHHVLNPGSMGAAIWAEVMDATTPSWGHAHGLPMVDYSAQQPDARRGRHAETADDDDLRRFLESTAPHDFDLMLEIKDKEASALCAVDVARADPRFVPSADRATGHT